jgi:hypothetical protein
MKRNPDGTINMDALDPHVASAFEEGQRRQVARSKTKAQRNQAKRNRLTIDLPKDLEDRLFQDAAALSVPVSQLVVWLLLRGSEVTSQDELMNARKPSRSMRYEFVLFTNEGDTKRRH